jgi:hypothetical protein
MSKYPWIALLVASRLLAGEGEWIELLKGNDFKAWRLPLGDWKIDSATSEIANGDKGKTRDLVTQAEFGDIETHIEFKIPAHSNSGIYFMGRYEVQVYDSFGVAKDKYPGIECGGIYPRWINNQNVEGHSPRVNASKPPGEWQTFDVVFRAPRFDANGNKTVNAMFVKVAHNGTVIHEYVELTGPTRGGSPNNEKATGPLRFQGDHGPVAYRNLKIRRLTNP